MDAVIRAGFGVYGYLAGPNGTGCGSKSHYQRPRLQHRPRSAASVALTPLWPPAASSSPPSRPSFPRLSAHLQSGNIAPVDLAQAAIGPGMAVYTRYAKVLDAQGNPVSVRDALALINHTMDEVLAEQEGEFDPDTRWALAWFEQHGFAAGEYGVAETLSKAKNTSIAGMMEAGLLESKAGKVRLLRPEELPEEWDPATDRRLTVWKVVHHLVRVLESGGGDRSRAACQATRRQSPETAREPSLPALHSRRAQEPRHGSLVVQRTCPELAGDQQPRPRRISRAVRVFARGVPPIWRINVERLPRDNPWQSPTTNASAKRWNSFATV